MCQENQEVRQLRTQRFLSSHVAFVSSDLIYRKSPKNSLIAKNVHGFGRQNCSNSTSLAFFRFPDLRLFLSLTWNLDLGLDSLWRSHIFTFRLSSRAHASGCCPRKPRKPFDRRNANELNRNC